MSRFLTLELALKAAASTIKALDSVPKQYSPIKSQILRSSSSIPLNISEGKGRFGRDRLHHYRIAYGSLRETVTAIKLLKELGVNNSEIMSSLKLLDRTGAMLWKLMKALN